MAIAKLPWSLEWRCNENKTVSNNTCKQIAIKNRNQIEMDRDNFLSFKTYLLPDHRYQGCRSRDRFCGGLGLVVLVLSRCGLGLVLAKLVSKPSIFWSSMHIVIIVFAVSTKCTIAPSDFELRRYSSLLIKQFLKS